MTFPGPVAIDRMFPDSALIEVRTQDFDEEGTEVATYSTLAAGVPAQLSTSDIVSDIRTGEGSFEIRERRVILYGWYPALDETSRVTIAGNAYQVRGVAPDSWGIANDGSGWTVLIVEDNPVAEGLVS
jgi:hypothetical protein